MDRREGSTTSFLWLGRCHWWLFRTESALLWSLWAMGKACLPLMPRAVTPWLTAFRAYSMKLLRSND